MGREVFNGGEWTQARFNSFIKSALRTASVRWPPRYQCLADAYRCTKVNEKTGRQAKHFECAICAKLFTQQDVEINHKDPVVPVSGFDSWDAVIDRMFCEGDALECLCKPCHKAMTKEENQLRRTKK